MKKLNKFIKGQLDGSKQEAMQVDQEEKKQKNNSIDQAKLDAVVLVLKEVEKILGDGQASGIGAVVESQLVGKPRDKELKGTKSWSTNCLIRLYHSSNSLKK